MVMFHALLEGTLVKYVLSGALPPTTHSGDTALMRFGAFRWHFMCLCNFWVFIRPQIAYRYTGEGGVYYRGKTKKNLSLPFFLYFTNWFTRRMKIQQIQPAVSEE